MSKYICIPGRAYLTEDSIHVHVNSIKVKETLEKTRGYRAKLKDMVENVIGETLTGFTFTWDRVFNASEVENRYESFKITFNEVEPALKLILGDWYDMYERQFSSRIKLPTGREIMRYGIREG